VNSFSDLHDDVVDPKLMWISKVMD